MAEVVEYYNYVVKECSDPRVYNWPLLAEPWKILGIITVYLYLVYIYLPSHMIRRTPFDLKRLTAVYNVYQIVACTILVYGISTSGWTTTYTFGCQTVDYSETKTSLRMAKFMWWHMILKMSELIETIIFVLRKKFNQVSFLHVYHHVSTLLIAWSAAKYWAGGMISFTVLINSSVHIIMYTYYFLSLFGREMQEKMKWIKPKITIIQMTQLVIILFHSAQVLLPGCSVPNVIAYFYLPNISLNIFLFTKMYIKSYFGKPKMAQT